jgi:hypothetical protein
MLYKFVFGWYGLVWTSGSAITIAMVPDSWSHLRVEHEIPGFHAQATWMKRGSFAQMWDELFDPDKPGFEYRILRVRSYRCGI